MYLCFVLCSRLWCLPHFVVSFFGTPSWTFAAQCFVCWTPRSLGSLAGCEKCAWLTHNGRYSVGGWVARWLGCGWQRELSGHRDSGGSARCHLNWQFLLLALQLRLHFKALYNAPPPRTHLRLTKGNAFSVLPGHAAQSADFWICGPAHWAPPFKGIGFVQVRVRLRPWLGLPLHLHSRHGLQALQPPFTVDAKRKTTGSTGSS